jgi:F-type H+-transporting ATPase subunit alpha
LTELLKQPEGNGAPFEEQVAIVWAATNGFMDAVAVSDIGEFEKKFLQFIRDRHAKILKNINESTELKPETEKALKETATDFTANYWKRL